jgi:hypothetical protein
MPTYGPLNFTTFASTGPGVAAWNLPDNAELLDAVLSTAIGTIGSDSDTEYLVCTGAAGLSIPSNERVTAITVHVARAAVFSDGTDFATDKEIFLVVAGSIRMDSANQATATHWPTSIQTVDYAPSNVWGLALTNADYMAAGFGIAFRAQKADIPPNGNTLSVDWIGITFETEFLGASDEDTDEMTTAYLNDNITFYVPCRNYGTGVPTVPDSAPTFEVYEATTGTPIVTGVTAAIGSATGWYGATFAVSAGAGFEVGKCYGVRYTYAISAVVQAAIGERLIVRPAIEASLPGGFSGMGRI